MALALTLSIPRECRAAETPAMSANGVECADLMEVDFVG